MPTAMKMTSLARTAPASSVLKSMPPRAARERQHLFQMRLVDGRFAALQAGDFGRVGIHAGHVVAQVGKTRAGDRADISGSDYGDSHGRQRAPRTPCGEYNKAPAMRGSGAGTMVSATIKVAHNADDSRDRRR